jgi:hypothetical protein
VNEQVAQHCPYLGLKQSQAIRFSDPTPEHRCYAAGGAQDIPQSQHDYQARYCLSAEHRRCPLYTGLVYTTTPDGAAAAAAAAPRRAVFDRLRHLNSADRRLYQALVSGLALLLCVYVIVAAAWFAEQQRLLPPADGRVPALTAVPQP